MLFELISRVAIATFVVLFSTNPFAPATYAAEGVPDRLRNIQFEYRTDMPVTDSQAHKLRFGFRYRAKTGGSGSKRFRLILHHNTRSRRRTSTEIGSSTSWPTLRCRTRSRQRSVFR